MEKSSYQHIEFDISMYLMMIKYKGEWGLSLEVLGLDSEFLMPSREEHMSPSTSQMLSTMSMKGFA
jgi:hypothetical protein